MQSLKSVPASLADGAFFEPICADGRYQIGACVGNEQVITHTDDRELAETVFETCFVKQFADNRDAHGGIYDRDERRYIRTWRGGPRPKPQQHPMVGLFQKMVESGQPVLLITEDRILEFNVERGGGK